MKQKKHESRRPARLALLPLIAALALLLAPLRLQASEFVLLYSNDNHGEVDPCG